MIDDCRQRRMQSQTCIIWKMSLSDILCLCVCVLMYQNCTCFCCHEIRKHSKIAAHMFHSIWSLREIIAESDITIETPVNTCIDARPPCSSRWWECWSHELGLWANGLRRSSRTQGVRLACAHSTGLEAPGTHFIQLGLRTRTM